MRFIDESLSKQLTDRQEDLQELTNIWNDVRSNRPFHLAQMHVNKDIRYYMLRLHLDWVDLSWTMKENSSNMLVWPDDTQ